MRKLSEPLIYLGWSLFGTALFCPALGDGSGWKCLLMTLCCFPMWLSWPVAVGAVANFMLFFGVLVYCWGGGLERKTYGLFMLVVAVAAVVVVVLMREDARVGAYLWLTSLFATALGFLLADTSELRRLRA